MIRENSYTVLRKYNGSKSIGRLNRVKSKYIWVASSVFAVPQRRLMDEPEVTA